MSSQHRYRDGISLANLGEDLTDAAAKLKDILLAHPDVKLPGLMEEIEALAKSRPHPKTVRAIISKMMEVGLASESTSNAFSRKQILFGLDMLFWFFVEADSPAQDLVFGLSQDIAELDLGIVLPNLRRTIKGRPPDNRFVRAGKTASAAMCHTLIVSGLRPHEAASKVAEVLNRQKMSLQLKSVGWRTVLQWRRSLRHTEEFGDQLAVWGPGAIEFETIEEWLRDFEKDVATWRVAELGLRLTFARCD
jgi:hypothetical protein